MNLLRKILFPFSILYGFITSIRNLLFNYGILKSYFFDLPIIAVGNLSVGGTGKSPQIEYLIRLLFKEYTIATLSRGYKRKSEGFLLANESTKVEEIGDEPFQFFQKFSNIQVAVDANRKNGIEQLLSQEKKPEIILLDDAYQHRKVKAGFYIMLTAFSDLFYDDFMLPTGNLRESRSGAKRANMIIVTKCPKDLSGIDQNKIEKRIKEYAYSDTLVFFSFIDYGSELISEADKLSVKDFQLNENIIIAGIAKPEPFFAYLQAGKNSTMVFPDHHHFSESDIESILQKANGHKIITTEKDYVRLKGKLPENQLYYLPIETKFLTKEDQFNSKIINYVRKNSRNS